MRLNKNFLSMIKKCVYNVSIIRKLRLGKRLYNQYKKVEPITIKKFIAQNICKFYLQPLDKDKSKQICKLFKRIDIVPVKSDEFFYSIDCYKSMDNSNQVLINYTINYDKVVNQSLGTIIQALEYEQSEYSRVELEVLSGIKAYIQRCKDNTDIRRKYTKQLDAIEGIFEAPAETLFEGLQRILFYNQLLWQTNHQHNGFGRLDQILYRVYKHDLDTGVLSYESAKKLIKEFLKVLHEYYWFKSGMMLGDTGQIIIVGGIDASGKCVENDLTKIFMEATMELMLPEPKVLLRCSSVTPDETMRLALDSIATGIGAPLLSNDDYVIPNLISYGYDLEDAYNYSASACWEPLITDNSCDLNNIKSFNFVIPFIRLLNSDDISNEITFEQLLELYQKFLTTYVDESLQELETLQFEEDPLLSLVSSSSITRKKDITRGGAVYYNLGLTSVGIGNVVNSLLNIKKLVFDTEEISLVELNSIRKCNFEGNEQLLIRLKNLHPYYGLDDNEVITLVNQIVDMASSEFEKHQTMMGGKFKFGLSSPYYIQDAGRMEATLDGRKDGEPFNVHISANSPVPLTSLLLFASKLNYSGNRLNGNVVDAIILPKNLQEEFDKYLLLLKGAVKEGVYQIQLNVVDSKTLIAARKNPSLFPNLIVRVWGFSAYFNDLPDEYKELLIKRAVEAEKAA